MYGNPYTCRKFKFCKTLYIHVVFYCSWVLCLYQIATLTVCILTLFIVQVWYFAVPSNVIIITGIKWSVLLHIL
jgi:hypothetical protein